MKQPKNEGLFPDDVFKKLIDRAAREPLADIIMHYVIKGKLDIGISKEMFKEIDTLMAKAFGEIVKHMFSQMHKDIGQGIKEQEDDRSVH